MKVYLNKEYKCVKVEDNTFVANDSSNYIRYYFVTNANGNGRYERYLSQHRAELCYGGV